jgi:hypothetical protein
VLLLPPPKQSVVVVVAVGHPALDQLSVPAVTVRTMVDDPKSEWWSKKAPQVYARFAGDDPNAPPRWLPDGAADKTASFDPQGRTYRQLTKAGLMVCPMKACEPFSTTRQGVNVRSHFCHAMRRDDALHRGGAESVWHQQAKFAVHDWLAAVFDSAELADLQLEYEKLLALGDGRRRYPDVYVEFKDGARVAFECQQQTMAGTDPRDHCAIWQARMADYRGLRERLGLRVVWFVSPWATTGNPKFEGDNVWRVEVYGGHGAQMLEAGETVYWMTRHSDKSAPLWNTSLPRAMSTFPVGISSTPGSFPNAASGTGCTPTTPSTATSTHSQD